MAKKHLVDTYLRFLNLAQAVLVTALKRCADALIFVAVAVVVSIVIAVAPVVIVSIVVLIVIVAVIAASILGVNAHAGHSDQPESHCKSKCETF